MKMMKRKSFNQWLIRHKIMQLYNSEKNIQNFKLGHCSYLRKMYLKSVSRGNDRVEIEN